MFPRILVPVDGTTASSHAFDQALRIAERDESIVSALCVIDARVRKEAQVYVPINNEIRVSKESVPFAQAQSTYEAWAEQVVRQAEVRGNRENVDVDTDIVTGIPYQEIVKRASPYDLLVMGLWNTSNSYPGPFLGGNTVWHVVAGTYLPAICVPDAPRDIDTILVAYDDSHEARDTLQLAATWSYAWDLKLIVLTVQPDGDTAQNILRNARARSWPAAPRLIARDGDPARVILSFADENDCNLIALGVHADRFVLRHSLGSVVDAVLHTSTVPVLLSH